MPLLDSGEAGDGAEGKGSVGYFNEAQAQRQEKKKKAGELIGSGVQQHQLLPADKAGDKIDQPQQCDQPHPNPKPGRQGQDRQQLDQANRQKHHIRNAVQPGTQGACAVGSAGNIAVQHVAQPGSQVQPIEARGQGGKEEQQKGKENAAASDQIGHCITTDPNN